MAVAPAVEPLLKSNPDMGKINGMSGWLVTVTKHAAAKGTPGASVIVTQEMSKADLLSLQAKLPLTYGAGWFKFIVTDSNSGAEDAWMVKLGVDPSAPQEGFPMAGQFPGGPTPSGPIRTPEGVIDLGHGFFYNETLGTLTTPWRGVHNWKPGEPMPEAPAGAPGGARLAAVPPNATPWNWAPPGMPGMPGQWGGYPSGPSETDLLKAELAEEKRRREREEDRAEQRRREEDQRRRDDERDKRFEQMIATLTAKPQGPSEELMRVQRELEETKRRTEAAEAETRRREEMRLAEERHRTEMQALKDTIREIGANKADPMMTMFGQILQAQTTSQAETVRTIRDAAAATAAVAERSAVSPIQILEMVRTSGAGASENSRTVMESMKGLLDTQREVMGGMIALAREQDSGAPWWAGTIQEGLNKIGTIGQALAEKRAEEAAQPQYVAPVQQQQPRVVQQPQQARPVAGRPVQQRVAPPAPQPPRPGAPTNTGERPVGTQYDAKTEEFVLPGGYRVKQSEVETWGWRSVLEKLQTQTPIVVGPAPVAVVEEPVHTNGAPKKGRGKKVPAAAPPPPEPPAPPPGPRPPANGQGYTIAELRDMEAEEIMSVVEPIADEQLFGPLLPSVVDLRGRVAKGMLPAKAAEAALSARQYLQSFGGNLPPIFDLLMAEHFEVVAMRLVPDAPEAYQGALAEAMEAQVEAEGGGAEAGA